MKKRKKSESFEGKDLLLRDLRDLIGVLEGDCTPEAFLEDLEEVYVEIVAMLISSLPEEEHKEALKEQMEILIGSIIEMMEFYKGGSVAERAPQPEETKTEGGGESANKGDTH